MSAKNYIDWDLEANYPLQWIYESMPARFSYQCEIHRANLAMQGKPSRNLYKEELESNLKSLTRDELSDDDRARCLCVPEGESFALRKAVQNRMNQMASGVDSYECKINDPYMLVEPDTEDLLAAKCEQDYIESKLGVFASVFSRDLTLYGVTAALVNYCPITDKNEVLRINPKNIWFDTMYVSTGKERFRGYSTMISFAKLKEMIEREGDDINPNLSAPDRSIYNKNGVVDKHIKVGDKKITTINDLEIYIQDMNKLAASPDLQGYPMTYFSEYDHDLSNCYNLGWYHTLATDPEARTKSGYNGDDVELTIIYDLDRKIEFKIINRRFVISANGDAFRREIAFQIYNPVTDQMMYRVDDYCLDCPLKFQFEEQAARDIASYPISPVFPLLDEHDKLCAWRAKREHVTKILSILRIETGGADATSLRKVLNVMGVILDDIQGDINSINFAYDYNPIDSEIAYIENTIKIALSAYDQFDAMQAMGDRASAAESGMALGAVAQGLATHQNAIMQLYADIARQCLGNRVMYSPNQEFPVTNLGQNSSITIQQMALNAIINVKPKLAVEIHQKTLAANAIAIVSNFKDVLTADGIAYFLQQGMLGQLPRKLASTFVNIPGTSEQQMALAQQQAQNQAMMLKQNQMAYEQNPVPYEVDNVMQNATPDEIDQVIASLNGATSGGGAIEPPTDNLAQAQASPELLDMQGQEGALDSNLKGMTPEMASQAMNPNAMVG